MDIICNSCYNCIKELNMKIYKPAVFSVLIGVSIKTLQRWDNNGILKAGRTPTNRRYYTEIDLDNYLKKNDF